MTNKEVEEKIASMERELAELKSKLFESDQSKMWQPKDAGVFWVLTGDGLPVCAVNNSEAEKKYIEQGNYFRTQEEANKQAEYNRVMNRFRKYVEAYSEPIDKNDYSQHKWYAWYDNGTLRRDYIFAVTAFQIYASSEQVLKDAIIYSAGSEEEFTRIVFNKGEK